MHAANRWVTYGVLAVMIVGTFGIPVTSAAAIASDRSTVALFHTNSVSSSQSTNWAGYAVTSGKHTVTDVKGSWVQPKVQGTCGSTNSYASFWVGIDGYNSRTVEQTGTDSDCQGGHATYYAWYEFFPRAPVGFSALTISVGDTISAEVKFANSKFTVTLTDVTTGHSASASAKPLAARNSAEWIAEAPSGSSGVLRLANFGNISFGQDVTSVSGTDYATISGTTAAIGSFTNVWAITMVNNAGTATKAAPSTLTPDQSSFNVTWYNPGP